MQTADAGELADVELSEAAGRGKGDALPAKETTGDERTRHSAQAGEAKT